MPHILKPTSPEFSTLSTNHTEKINEITRRFAELTAARLVSNQKRGMPFTPTYH